MMRNALLTRRFEQIKHAGHIHFPVWWKPTNLIIMIIFIIFNNNEYMNDVYT